MRQFVRGVGEKYRGCEKFLELKGEGPVGDNATDLVQLLLAPTDPEVNAGFMLDPADVAKSMELVTVFDEQLLKKLLATSKLNEGLKYVVAQDSVSMLLTYHYQQYSLWQELRSFAFRD